MLVVSVFLENFSIIVHGNLEHLGIIFKSQIKFVTLLTVNHTILIMFFQSIGSTNYLQIDIFLYILITYLVVIVLIL